MRNKFTLFLPIILLISLSQLNETIYAGLLPEVRSDLKISEQFLGYTLTSYFLGFGIGTLFWGHISDLIGRKKCVTIGTGAYIIGCYLCWTSDSFVFLVIARFIQGLSISFASVLGQVLVRDLVKEKNRSEVFNNINLVIAFIPAIGLTISVLLTKFLYWRAAFIVLIFVSIATLSFVMILIPKIQNIRTENKLFRECLKQILTDTEGLKLGFFVGGALGIMFGYFMASGYFFREIDISSIDSILIPFFASASFFVGAVISKKLHFNADKKIFFAVLTASIFSLIFYSLVKMNIISKTNNDSITLSLICIFPILGATSVIIPNCLSRILNNYGRYIGTAATIYGFYYYIVTAIFINIFDFINIKSIEGLPLFMLLSSAFILIVAIRQVRDLV